MGTAQRVQNLQPGDEDSRSQQPRLQKPKRPPRARAHVPHGHSEPGLKDQPALRSRSLPSPAENSKERHADSTTGKCARTSCRIKASETRRPTVPILLPVVASRGFRGVATGNSSKGKKTIIIQRAVSRLQSSKHLEEKSEPSVPARPSRPRT